MHSTANHPSPPLRDEAMLNLLHEVISEYVDVTGKKIDASTELVQLGVDSLTLAELLFALEDRIGTPMGEPTTMPLTVGDVIAFMKPHLDRVQKGLH
jgi:acyl carrier protein